MTKRDFAIMIAAAIVTISTLFLADRYFSPERIWSAQDTNAITINGTKLTDG